jgi:hypothetical protein
MNPRLRTEAMEKQTPGRQQLVRSTVEVDRWVQAPPSVEVARPGGV